MSLIKCPNCNNDVSDEAKKCPKCKKVLKYSKIFGIISIVGSCGLFFATVLLTLNEIPKNLDEVFYYVLMLYSVIFAIFGIVSLVKEKNKLGILSIILSVTTLIYSVISVTAY